MVGPNSYAELPFALHIAEAEMPRKFAMPSFKLYDGMTNPEDHIVVLQTKNASHQHTSKDQGSMHVRYFQHEFGWTNHAMVHQPSDWLNIIIYRKIH